MSPAVRSIGLTPSSFFATSVLNFPQYEQILPSLVPDYPSSLLFSCHFPEFPRFIALLKIRFTELGQKQFSKMWLCGALERTGERKRECAALRSRLEPEEKGIERILVERSGSVSASAQEEGLPSRMAARGGRQRAGSLCTDQPSMHNVAPGIGSQAPTTSRQIIVRRLTGGASRRGRRGVESRVENGGARVDTQGERSCVQGRGVQGGGDWSVGVGGVWVGWGTGMRTGMGCAHAHASRGRCWHRSHGGGRNSSSRQASTVQRGYSVCTTHLPSEFICPTTEMRAQWRFELGVARAGHAGCGVAGVFARGLRYMRVSEDRVAIVGTQLEDVGEVARRIGVFEHDGWDMGQ
ncbi:hypothetical protein B0H14DRAFT_2638130 [Mycena olivaceomarginata]|nr:hypothetical protein B0H14DRAFT_2638130 [Mycena olivaceomarginata]